MDLLTISNLLLIGAAIAACGAVVWLAREAVLTARSLRTLTDDVQTRLIPILDKADVTVDALNAELLRIDGAITTFEDAGARASAAAETLSDFVSSPAGTVAETVRRRWRERKRHEPSEPVAPGPVEWPETGDAEEVTRIDEPDIGEVDEPGYTVLDETIPDD